MAFFTAASVRMSRVASPRVSRPTRARAERRAASSQIGCPDGARAEWGRARPSASPTTWDVAAVPRNWQPPPAEPQARQPMSAARSSVISPWAKRAPMDCTVPASSASFAGSVTPARDEDARQVPHRGERHHHRGEALVARGYPEDPAARRERADQAPEDLRRVVPVRQAVHHPDRALGPAVARVGDEAGERQALEATQLVGGRLHQEADLPVARVIAEGDRLAVGGADAALGREDQELGTPELPRIPPHARVLGPAEEIAARPVEEHLRRERKPACRPRPHRLDVVEPGRAADDLVESDGRPPALRCAHWFSAASAHWGSPPRSLRTAPPRRSRASVHASRGSLAERRPVVAARPCHASVASARSASAGGSRPLPASRSWKSRRTATPVPARSRWRSRIARISRQPTRYADAWVGEAA